MGVSVAGYVGIARFSRFGLAKPVDTTSETPRFLISALNERILTTVSVAWWMRHFSSTVPEVVPAAIP